MIVRAACCVRRTFHTLSTTQHSQRPARLISACSASTINCIMYAKWLILLVRWPKVSRNCRKSLPFLKARQAFGSPAA